MSSSRTFELANELRGRLAERILTIFLERGGFRVTRVGIEELFHEVKYIDKETYLALGLPEQLRTIPDLLVTDPGVKWAKLIEVKYRRLFDQRTVSELRASLNDQSHFWSEAFLLIVRGQSRWPDAHFHQDYIRVIPMNELWRLDGPRGYIPDTDPAEVLWEELPMLGRIFHFADFAPFGDESEKRGLDFFASADSITAAIRDLALL